MARTINTHGHTAGGKNSPTYQTWQCMWQRCTDPEHPSFPWYGAEGISVDPSWKSFGRFLADMGERPEGLTLDRIDNAQNYAPGNCRWATKLDQMRNRRNTRWLTIGLFRLTFAEWCVVFGTARETAYRRTERGLSLIDAVSLPPLPRGPKPVSGVRVPKIATKPAPSVDRRGNRRPRPRMTAKEFRAHQAARLATRG